MTQPLPQALPNRLENVRSSIFLDRNDIMIAEHKTNLLEDQFSLRFFVSHLQDDEKLLLILVDVWSLAGIEHIFQRERMNSEMFAQFLQGPDVTQAADVDPAHS